MTSVSDSDDSWNCPLDCDQTTVIEVDLCDVTRNFKDLMAKDEIKNLQLDSNSIKMKANVRRDISENKPDSTTASEPEAMKNADNNCAIGNKNEGMLQTEEDMELCEKFNLNLVLEDSNEENAVSPNQYKTEESDTFGILPSGRSPLTLASFLSENQLLKTPRRNSPSLFLTASQDGRQIQAIIPTPPLLHIPIPFNLPPECPESEDDTYTSSSNIEDASDLSSIFDKAFIAEESVLEPFEETLYILSEIITTRIPTVIEAQIMPPLGLNLHNVSEHQKFGLQWALWMEHQLPKGGVLAEDVGYCKELIFAGLVLKSIKLFNSKENSSETSPLSSDSRRASHATLLVCHKKSLQHLENTIRSKANSKVSIYVYHGAKRTKEPKDLISHDIVLTTYVTIAFENPTKSYLCLYSSPLNQINWDRIILDKGESIQKMDQVASQAILRFKANYRWVVLKQSPRKGFPHGIVKFLEIAPFDDDKVWERFFGRNEMKMRENVERLNIIRRSLTPPQYLH